MTGVKTENSGGTSSGTEAGFRLTGKLVFAGGKAADGATVSLFTGEGQQAESASVIPMATTSSDENGRYAFSKLGTGIYSLHAVLKADSVNGDSLAMRRPRIVLDKPLDLGTDTLQMPGGIRGWALGAGKPLSGAFCYIPGTSSLAITDSLGACTISGVAPGSYEVAFWAQGYLTTALSPVVVASGKITVLEPVGLTMATGTLPNAPDGLKSVFDHRTGIVALTWRAGLMSFLKGYLVYRWDEHGNAILLTEKPVKDTAFRDTVYRGTPYPESALYIYSIKVVDGNGNEGLFGKPESTWVTAPPGIYLPFPGNGSEAMDTALDLQWKVIGRHDSLAIKAEIFLDTLPQPRQLLEKFSGPSKWPLTGLRPEATYFWRVRTQVDSLWVEGPVWTFRTGSGLSFQDSSELAYVDVWGAREHLRLSALPGQCGACAQKPELTSPLVLDFGPGVDAVVQVYKNSRPIPVFPAGDPNRPYEKKSPIALEAGDWNYELKIWKPGEGTPRISMWFSIAKD